MGCGGRERERSTDKNKEGLKERKSQIEETLRDRMDTERGKRRTPTIFLNWSIC